MQSIPPLQVLFNQAARTTAPLRGLLWSSSALRSSWATHSMDGLATKSFLGEFGDTAPSVTIFLLLAL